ncbi:MAG TPA: DUF1801 domain-containing protein [Polyangiaceae bacterium]
MPRRAEVDKWLAAYDNPMKAVVTRVREVILSVDARIDECIKWQTPTFMFEGNIASFNPRSKSHASLLFHAGATIPGKHPRLEGSGDVARTMKFGSVAEVESFERDLARTIQAWIAMKSNAMTREHSRGKSLTARGAAAKKKAAQKKAAQKKATPKQTARRKSPRKKAIRNNAAEVRKKQQAARKARPSRSKAAR